MRHHLINLSQANPILINGVEIEPEREYDIHPGDQIQIGLYLLRAEAYLGQGAAANLNTMPPMAARVDAPAPAPAPVQATQHAAAPEAAAPVNLQTLPPRPAANPAEVQENPPKYARIAASLFKWRWHSEFERFVGSQYRVDGNFGQIGGDLDSRYDGINCPTRLGQTRGQSRGDDGCVAKKQPFEIFS